MLTCKLFGHDFVQFTKVEIMPHHPDQAIKDSEEDEALEIYKQQIVAWMCRKCGFVRNYTHNFTRKKETK